MSLNAEILSVGTELLLGDTLNTNARFLSKRLAEHGINVFYQTTVGDNAERLKNALETAFSRAELVVTTGGLGPTGDDLTKETVAEYFKRELVRHEPSYKALKQLFAGREMTENNVKQAYFPRGAQVFPNKNGTAPGFLMSGGAKLRQRIIIVLPGPPSEMEPMFEACAAPFLRTISDSVLFSVSLRFADIGESAVEDRLKDLMDGGENPTVAPYAKQGGVVVRLTAKAAGESSAKALIEPVKAEIYNRLGAYIVAESDGAEPPPTSELLVNALIGKRLTVAAAESCTGGLLSAAFVSVAGASDTFKDGVIAYDNASKTARLGVKTETLEKFGAVSPETAAEMAEGVRRALNVDIGVSTTGIAGPAGGTDEKPVGLVYVGISIKGDTTVKELRLPPYGRQKVRERAVREALAALYKEVRLL